MANDITTTADATEDKGKQYTVYNSRWTAIPLGTGTYQVTSEQVGQVIYVSDNPAGNGALRLTKNFQIETSGRTTMYVKGQNALDIKIMQLEASLASKADREDTYTMAQVDELIKNSLGGVAGNGVHFKDILPTEADILAKADTSELGDLYQARDTGSFYIYTDEGFKQIGSSILDLSNYYTKAEIEVKLQNKANQSDYLTLKATVDSLMELNGGFKYIQKDTPDLQSSTEGDTWFNPGIPMIYVCKTDAQGTKFWYSIGDQIKVDFAALYVGLSGDQSIDGVKTFSSLPQSPKAPTNDNDLTNKSYVDSLVRSTNANLVTLDTEQTISSVKTFTATPKLTSEVTDDADLTNKSYVDKAILNAALNDPDIDISNYYTKAEANSVFIDLTNAQEITGTKTFSVNQTLTATPTSDTDLVNKGYVDNAIETNVPNIDTSNLAKLSEANTFTGTNSFNAGLTTTITPTNAYDVTNKTYVDGAIETAKEDIKNNIPTTDLSNYAVLSGKDNTFSNNNNFSEAVTLAKGAKSLIEPTEDSSLTTKSYVDGIKTNLQGKIDDITNNQPDLNLYAKLASENTFSAKNTFTGAVVVNNTPTSDYEVANKKYVDSSFLTNASTNGYIRLQGYYSTIQAMNDYVDSHPDADFYNALFYVYENKSYYIFLDYGNGIDAGERFILLSDTEIDLGGVLKLQGNKANSNDLQAAVSSSKTGDVWYVADTQTFFVFKDGSFYPLGGGKTNNSDFVDLTTDQTIAGVKTFTNLPKSSKTVTSSSDVNDNDLVTKQILNLMSRIAAKSDGSIIWTESEYNAEPNKDPNKLYSIEGDLLEEFPAAKNDNGSFVWTASEYQAKSDAGDLENKFYFVLEPTT